MVQREEMYFEPRCVGSDLRIRWYGEQYSAPELERHYEETVYIRDSGKELMVYSMEADCWDEKAKIKATFSLICRIQKHMPWELQELEARMSSTYWCPALQERIP